MALNALQIENIRLGDEKRKLLNKRRFGFSFWLAVWKRIFAFKMEIEMKLFW